MVSVYMSFPNLDPVALGEHIEPVLSAVAKAGGLSTSVNIRPWDPDDAGLLDD
jgi:hypothetical protein